MNPHWKIQPAQVKLFNVALTALQKAGVAITKAEMKERFRVESTKDLTNAQFDEAMQHFEACGFVYRPKKGPQVRTPAPLQRIKQAHLAAIGKLLNKLERDWAYAEGIARQMFELDKVVWQWLSPEYLHKVQTALIYEVRKQFGPPVERREETLAKRRGQGSGIRGQKKHVQAQP
jgi:hypothetical protein